MVLVNNTIVVDGEVLSATPTLHSPIELENILSCRKELPNVRERSLFEKLEIILDMDENKNAAIKIIRLENRTTRDTFVCFLFAPIRNIHLCGNFSRPPIIRTNKTTTQYKIDKIQVMLKNVAS